MWTPTLMEQQRAVLTDQGSMSSDEARSSDSVTESSSKTSSSHEESEISQSSDNTGAKGLQEIYKELAESVTAFAKNTLNAG